MDELCASSEVELRLSTIAVDAQWSERKYTLPSLVAEFRLPQVARFEDVGGVMARDVTSRVDVTKPVIVYSQRRRTKVRVFNL